TADEMIRRKLIDEAAVADLRDRCEALMRDIAERLVEPEGNRRRIRPGLWPDKAFVDVGIRAPLPAHPPGRRTEEEARGLPMAERRFVDAIADLLNRRFATDPSLVLMGEDVHRLKGGTNGATRGLADAHPRRVLGTPISEGAFTGLAGGLAIDGRYRPIVEFMYPDFMWVAADQVFNQIGKARHMFGDDTDVPLVLRTKIAMGTGYGSQHSL